MAAARFQPTCDTVPDEDQGDRVTLLTGSFPPKSSKSRRVPASVGSDSGYSSLSKVSRASSSSKTSDGKTLKPPRDPASLHSSRARTSNNATKSTAPVSANVSRSSSRSQSKVRTSSHSCQDPNCDDCKMSRKQSGAPPPPLNTSGHWERRSTSAAPSPHPISPPQVPYTAPQPVLAPPVPHYAPPPAAVPRQQTRGPSAPPTRPISIAAPGTLVYPSPSPAQQRPPSFHMPTNTPPYPPQQLALPSRGTPYAPQGTYITTDAHRGRLSHPAPPPPTRPTIPHRPTDATVAPGRRTSMYGGAQVHQYSSTPPTGYYEQGQIEMGPPPAPQTHGYPPRTSSYQPVYDDHNRRQSMSYDQPGYFDIDPQRTIRAQREPPARPSILGHPSGKSKSTSYWADGASHMATVERTVPMQRYEKINHDSQRARAYQDRFDAQVHGDTDALAEELSFMDVGLPPSPQHRRMSQSHHGRTQSRAGSSASRLSTDTAGVKLSIEPNGFEVSGNLEGNTLTYTTTADGRPSVTMIGSGSPTKTRDTAYVPGSSLRSSNGSFAERSGRRRAPVASPTESATMVSSSVSRRQSVAGRRPSHGHRPR